MVIVLFIPPLDESQEYIGILMSVHHTFGFRIIIKVPLNQIFSNFHTHMAYLHNHQCYVDIVILQTLLHSHILRHYCHMSHWYNCLFHSLESFHMFPNYLEKNSNRITKLTNTKYIQWNLSNPTYKETREICHIVQDVWILTFYFSSQKYFGTFSHVYASYYSQSICFEIISWHPSSWQKSWLSAGLIHRISFWLWARML
jgi:hypothetical protein